MPKFLLSLLVDKDSLYTHNWLYTIESQYYWIKHNGSLGLYKLRKECLRVKLTDKIIF